MSACTFCGGDSEVIVRGSWTWLIEKDAASLNKRHVNDGHRGHMYRRERNQWLQWCQLAMVNQRIPKATHKRRATFTRMFGDRMRPFDYANFVGGLKPLVDAMVECGLLVDDSPKMLEDHYMQMHVELPGRKGVHILLESIAT